MLVTALLTLLSWLPAGAQGTAQQGIIEYLVEESDSTLTIEMVPSILEDFVPREPTAEPAPSQDKTTRQESHAAKSQERRIAKNFTIQVFSDGRNQATLQARARKRVSQIMARFSRELSGQVKYRSASPNYYAYVGFFASRQDANKVLGQLRRAFPSFANEMRVVNFPK